MPHDKDQFDAISGAVQHGAGEDEPRWDEQFRMIAKAKPKLEKPEWE